ncbi:hypothetical protein CLOLEP_01280 [[Clostridium] leptum DSM 753]|uniref:Uncharacterized protein n=1 Tax=[Clostridium] leptum DSM 753 TaxID=428125 RepID=A7VRU6_9FIRM|nr:hypothetical protein CLOLEP_01280 [[Clostridium] leptum DSM 753]
MPQRSKQGWIFPSSLNLYNLNFSKNNPVFQVVPHRKYHEELSPFFLLFGLIP